MIPLKCSSNFWKIIEMPLVNGAVNLILTWSNNLDITNVANQFATFTIAETNLYVLIITLSTQDNTKLLPQLKSVLKEESVGMNIY